MPQIPLATVLSAAGVIVGFQVAAFTLRINREISVGDQRRVTWLPFADYVNLASLSITLLGVFAAPVTGIYREATAVKVRGLALVLLACYPFVLSGHYELFTTAELGETFERCYSLRERADYEYRQVSRTEAERALPRATHFLAVVEGGETL